jgi:tetratricopeptide (TPR) repeat protein
VKEYTPEMDLSKTKLFLIETSQEVNSSDSYNNAIKRVSSLIRDGNDRLQERTDKGILLLGNTSAGKSTLAHLLSGRKLQGIKDEETGDMIIDALQPLKDIVIGHKMASETKIPNKCLANGTVIWDCPGFNDTEPDQEIANSFYIKRLSETIDQIKLILVVPEHHIVRDNGKHFIDTLSSFMKTFSNLDAMEGSISLIITQVPANKEPQHIEKSIERILRDNQGVTEEQKILVTKLNSSLHLFHRPTQEGELIAINPLEYINSSCQYVKGNPGMASIIVSKAAMKYSYHLLETAASNFNKILEVTVRAIADATNCLNVNKNNLFVQNYPMIKDWVPESVHYNKLVLHEKNEYFLELDLLNKLQKILTSNKISSILDGLNVLQRVIETIAEYVDSGISSKHQIQDYGYCLQQQYEYVKFFASVCGKELPGEASLAELLALCSSKVLENLEFQVSNLHIDQTQLDKSYYRKAIDYLEKYPDSKPCTKLNALCYSGWASVAECKGESDLAIGLYLKAIKVNNQIPEVYEKLGMLFYSKGQYTKAIEAYKAVNNEFKIKECFKAWLTQDAENPDIMLMQAEYFESIGRFEAARKYYGFASSLSKNETFKSNICQKISGTLNSQTQNITLKAQEFSQKALTQEFYNFDAFKFVVETMDTQVIPNQKKPQKVSAKVTEPVKHVVQTGADKLDATWYDYLAIKDSLIKKGIDAKHILNTVKNNDELAVELDKIKEANSFYIIPLNVNALDGGFGTTSHWVGLHICTNAEAQIIAVKYLNPIGQKINKLLSGIISQKTGIVPKDITFGEGPQFAYEELEIELKGNINDCGPMLVQLFYELVNNGEILTKLLNEEESLAFGQKCRKEQKYDEGNELKETFTISGTVEVPEAIPTIAESDLAGVNSVLITDSAHC